MMGIPHLIGARERFYQAGDFSLTELDVTGLTAAFITVVNDILRKRHRRTQRDAGVAHIAEVLATEMTGVKHPIDAVPGHGHDGFCVTCVDSDFAPQLVRHPDNGTQFVVVKVRSHF